MKLSNGTICDGACTSPACHGAATLLAARLGMSGTSASGSRNSGDGADGADGGHPHMLLDMRLLVGEVNFIHFKNDTILMLTDSFVNDEINCPINLI